MIRLRDTATLALTKLRTRKVRLVVTIFVSGLLFSAVTGASLVVRGGFASIEDFSEEGFGNRFIIAGYRAASFGFVQDPAIMDRAEAIHKDLVARKKVEAKRLGIVYEPGLEQGPVQEYDMGGVTSRSLDTTNPAAAQAITEYLATKDVPGLTDFELSAADYGAEETYVSRMMIMSGSGSIKVLKDGKESFDQSANMMGMPKGLDSLGQLWQTSSKGLLKPFTLPGQTLDSVDTDEVPIIVPVSAAEELLGLEALPDTAKASDKLEYIKHVRANAGNIKFDICVRNGASNELIGRSLSALQELSANQNNKQYVKPSLVYGLPSEPCGAVPIIRDVRTAAEKTLAAKQDEFDRLFGKQVPTQTKISFRVAGIVPDFDMGPQGTVEGILQGLVASSLGPGWYTPDEYIAAHPELAAFFDASQDVFAGSPTYYADFGSADSARRFNDEQGCIPNYQEFMGPSMSDMPDPYEECDEKGKFFELSTYGSNSMALDSAKRGFSRIFRYVALGIAFVAAVIMMGTVGRMIADSRRETAVFRAIGAKRLDIAQIYVLYTILLSLLICLFALAVGMLLAGFVHGRYASEATVQALVAYNAQDLERTFKLYAFYPPDILQLMGLAMAGGVISSILPLLRNLRRNPIRDMRDDT